MTSTSQPGVVAVVDPSTAPPRPMARPGGRSIRLVDATVGAETLDLHMNILEPGSRATAPYHLHSNAENVYFVLLGTLGLRLEGEDVFVDSGHAVFIPPGVPHSVWNAGETEARLLEIHAPPNADSSASTQSSEQAVNRVAVSPPVVLIRDWIEARKSDYLDLLSELVDIDSCWANPDGVREVGRIVSERLTGCGFDISLQRQEPLPPEDRWLGELLAPGVGYESLAPTVVARRTAATAQGRCSYSATSTRLSLEARRVFRST